MNCRRCGTRLYNDLNTYGNPGNEQCWACWSEQLDYEYDDGESWYGLAPHHHDTGITGSLIGSTVFDPLPDLPEGEIEYEIEPGLFFMPDSEVDGTAGIWRRGKPREVR